MSVNTQRAACYRELHPLATLVCRCGKTFQQKTGWQKFCEKGCANKLRVEDGRSAEAQRRCRARNPDRTRQINRESMRRRNATPEGKRYRKNFELKKYGITIQVFEAIAKQQNGLCATCLRTLDMGFNTHVDHDHKSGIVRGLLCSPCNRSIGGFRDDPATLRRAAEYLERKGKL